MKSARTCILLVGMLFLAGCGDDTTAPSSDDGGGTGPGNDTPAFLELALIVTNGDGQVAAGDTLATKLLLINSGGSAADSVVMTHAVPDRFEVAGAVWSTDANKSAEQVASEPFSLAAGDSALLRLSLIVPEFYPDSFDIILSATAGVDTAGSEKGFDHLATATDTVQCLNPADSHFRLLAPGVPEVYVAGEFNGWLDDFANNPASATYKLYPDGAGRNWGISFTAEAGAQYKYILSDPGRHRTEWITDPRATHLEPDGFGGFNAVHGLELPGRVAPLPGGIDPAKTVIYELFTYDFSASRNFQGVIEGLTGSLQDVADLGVTAIEILPVTGVNSSFSGTFNWGYEPSHYFAVNPNYGPPGDPHATPAKFAELVERAHQSGIAVILDMVFNHVGRHAALEKIDEMGENFTYINWDQGVTFGMNQTNWYSEDMRQLLLDVALFWIEQYGVDGFRMDLVDPADYPGWSWWVNEIKSRHPDFFIIGEDFRFPPASAVSVTGMDAQWGGSDTDRWGGFGSTFCHNLMALLEEGPYFGRSFFPGVGSFNTEDNPMWSLANVLGPNHSFPGIHNEVKYIVSHDEKRLVEEVDSRGSEEAQAIGGLQKAKLGAVSLFTATGIPMLFMGEEIGDDGVVPIFPAPNPVDWQGGDSSIRDWYKRLIDLRLTEPSLAAGGISFHCPQWSTGEGPCQQNKTICYWRYAGSDSTTADIVVVSNFDHDDHQFAVPFPRDGDWLKIGSEGDSTINVFGLVYPETLPASTAYIYLDQ